MALGHTDLSQDPDLHLSPRRTGRGSLITLGLVILCILGMGALAIKDWYPLISSPAFWNPPAREGK